MTAQQQANMQLTFRNEGDLLNAYVERLGDDPFVSLMGSINAHVCERDPGLTALWREMMRLATARLAGQLGAPDLKFTPAMFGPVGGTA